jgi:hypothetical protein
MVDEYNPKHGAHLAIPFSKADLTTGESNTDLLAQDGVGTVYVAPKAGSVVGISINASGAITAGTITARAHKDSTEFAQTGYPAPVSNATNEKTYANVRPGALRFAAGDGLGISVTTTTTLDPTNTEDVSAYLHIVLDPD